MKKVISAFTILWIIFFPVSLKADQGVNVNAIVWTPLIVPVILSTQPNQSQVLVQRNKIQEFSIFVQDTDTNDLNFTVTTEIWAVSPLSWTVTNANNWTYINFTFLAPSTKPSVNNKKITVTISDQTTTTIVKEFQLYIF